MKTLLLIFTIMCLSISVYSQDLFIENNPYENAENFIQKRKSFNRERWFYEQRMYPNNFMPDGAYKKAMDEKMALRQQSGFYYDQLNVWTSVGPNPGFYFNWSNISSRITTVKYDPSNPSTIYVGAAFGGVWKTTNSGATWVPKTDNLASLSSGALAIDPVNTNIIYYATGEATYSAASYYGRGVFKSTNGGDTWVNYTNGLPSQTFSSRLVIRPNHSNELFLAGGVNGLFKSTDAGMNWVNLNSGRCDDVVFSPSGDTAYITGSGTGYRISTDGGNNFVFNGTVTMGTRNHIAICKAVPSVLYIARYSGSTILVFKSTNAGMNFSQVASGHDFSGSQAWYDFFMHVNPFNPDIAYVGSVDTWRTTNGGASFQNITLGYANGPVHVDQQNMDLNPLNQQELLVVSDGGIWKSSNQGTNWTNINSGLTLTQFYRIASDPVNASHIMGGTQDNGTQRTTGTINWTGAFGGDGGEVCFHPRDPLLILGETQNNGVMRSVNGGASWSNAVSGLTGSGSWVAPIIAHPDSAGVFYTARGVVFKTTTTGASWTPISTGTTGTIREMAISKSNPQVMYATVGTSVYRSTNRGYTFTNVTSGLPGRVITSVNVHPDSSDVAILTFSGFGAGKMYKTSNGGANWFNISGNLPDAPANDGLIYYPGMATSVYLIATDIGVFMTNNYGASWVELADGLPNTVAMHLDYNHSANKLRIGTHGRGVYEITNLSGISNNTGAIPSEFKLMQNYPNPFNPSTTISYNIAKREKVSLKVFDMMGKEVYTLVNTAQDAGSYNIVFNASNLSSGVYFYKLETEDFSDTKKMIIVK
jgi:photosystem II stability/assembly factor-like uncharacterized protein